MRNTPDSRHMGPAEEASTMHRSLSRADWSVAVAVAILFSGLALYRMVPGVCGVHHDDGVFVLTAKALAAGEGYRLVQLPERPLQTKYPILYPAVLAVVWRAWPTFPDNLVAMQLLSCIAMTAALATYYLVFGAVGCAGPTNGSDRCDRHGHRAAARVFATLPMSEGLFMLALTAALWQTERLAATEGGGWGRRLACGLALTACALLRTAGLVIVIVMLVWLSRRRALKPSVIVMAVLPVLGWFAWTASAAVASDLRTAYYTSYSGWWTLLAPESVRVSGGRERAVGLERIEIVVAQGLWTYAANPVVICGGIGVALAAVWCAAAEGSPRSFLPRTSRNCASGPGPTRASWSPSRRC